MILVEGGTFIMGDNSDIYRYCFVDDFYPATEHQVTLSDYYIGQTEVTQALWKAVMGDLPNIPDRFSYLNCIPDWEASDKYRGDNKPLRAYWDQWQEFIDRLNELTGLKFRMPTEAEWEYAAMGGNRSRGYIYAGSNDLNEVAWYRENADLDIYYQPVAMKKPNELYLYDMSGNMDEWVSDWFAPYPSTPQTNPTGPLSGKIHTVRGSTYAQINTISYLKQIYRIKTRAEGYDLPFGLRLALSAE